MVPFLNRIPYSKQVSAPVLGLNKSFEGPGTNTVNNGMILSSSSIFEKGYDDEWAITFWIRRVIDSTMRFTVIKQGTDTVTPVPGLFIQVTQSGQTLIFSWDTASAERGVGLLTGTSPPLSTTTDWTLMTITYDGSRNFTTGLDVYSNTTEYTGRAIVNDPAPSDTVPFPQTPLTCASNTYTGASNDGADNIRVTDIAYWGVHFSSSDVSELYNSGTRLAPQSHSQAASLEHHFPFTNDTIDGGNDITDEVSQTVTGSFESAVTTAESSSDFPA